jgi:hypothetical protein
MRSPVPVADPVHQLVPAVEVGLAVGQVQLADDHLVQAVLDQAHRHLVDRVSLSFGLDHRLDGDVAEQGDLGAIVEAERCSVRHMRMSGWMPICRNWPTECCVGLVFSSPAAFK